VCVCVCVCSFVFREEVVDGRHDLRRARSKELAEATLSVLLSLLLLSSTPMLRRDLLTLQIPPPCIFTHKKERKKERKKQYCLMIFIYLFVPLKTLELIRT